MKPEHRCTRVLLGRGRSASQAMPDLQHGTRWAYIQGCRCVPCRMAAASYHRRHAKGLTPGLVDATVARRHVQALQRCGLGLDYLASIAGVSPETLRRLLKGRARISARVERCILGLVEHPLADGCRASFAESYRTREKLRRILDEGYPLKAVQQSLGFAVDRVVRRYGKGKMGRRVRVRTVRRVSEAYDRLVLGGLTEAEIAELDPPSC